MRFRKNVPLENREMLTEHLRQYKKEMKMTKEERRELEKWVASGRSPYDNGDYIYDDTGCPMDFVNALRFRKEQNDWLMNLTEEEREKELRNLRGDYDTIADDIIVRSNYPDFEMDPDEELPFS